MRGPLGGHLREFGSMNGSHILSAAAALLLACSSGTPVEGRSHFEQDLVSAVILQTIETLPDSADSARLAAYRAPTSDSARVLFRSMWASWWHTARDNRVQLTPRVINRFAKHFDPNNPPPNPYPDVPSWYLIRELRLGADSTTADIGPSFSGCKYSFARRAAVWVLVGDSKDCWIS
jgi:hypothetical protein